MTQAIWTAPAYGNGQQLPAVRRAQGLCLAVHAPPKSGKSCLADSGPRPTLILDLEGMAYWTPSNKLYWDPERETCPTWPQDPRAVRADGYWDSAIVMMRRFSDLTAMLSFLQQGQHPFNSVDLDSASEMQARFADELAPRGKLDRDHWGAMLRQVQTVIRGYRDLITQQTLHVWSVSLVLGTHWDERARKMVPLLQGQSRDYVPYYPDILGYMETQQDGSRQLLIGPHPNYETGERVGGRLPYSLQVGYPQTAWSPGWPGWTLEAMVQQVINS